MDPRGRAELAMVLMSSVTATAQGSTVQIPVDSADAVAVVEQWCRGTGNTVFAVHEDAVEVMRGSLADPETKLPADRLPGHRLWIYTNFHCNLACDYCCVASSPQADPRMVTLQVARNLVAEGMAAGVRELFLTGGEPFMNPDIAEIVALCAYAAPTVMLTNGMLYRGKRLEALEQMPRENFTLQVSVDSPTPARHDIHRGSGSWAKAIAGIQKAKSLGFDVRLAMTLSAQEDLAHLDMQRLCDDLELTADEIIVRNIAAQGVATDGIAISKPTVVPEVCATSEGIYWHPVAAADPQMKVTDDLFPLQKAIDTVTDEFLGYRRDSDILAATFPCA